MFSTRLKPVFNDDELLKGFNKRHEDAFCRVYEKYYNELVYFTRRLFSSQGELMAQDMVQDLFLKIWESEKQFESLDMLKSYLYFSLRNRWKNFLEHTDSVRKYQASSQTTETDGYVLAAIVESETLALFYEQLDMLSAPCAQVIRLGLQGLSAQEIAEQMQISVHTVYSHRQKAIQQLRNLLSKDMFHLFLFMLKKNNYSKIIEFL